MWNQPVYLSAPANPADAYAQYSSLIMIVLLFVLFYFLLIRPQQKRQKERNRMLNNLEKGDKVITIGGLHGTIVELNDRTVVLKVSDSVRLTFDKQAINAVLTESEKEKA
ncbi:component of the preprotein translocase (modular protein) [[Clostridium] ultunense Esp]|uniref:preprotein translocase subunit YajC n=1 Tax=Thermicanus aegyptius TaxID=94009 RepID=UPI0002B70833|nr:component of the preprotein translocase (modular protein) [[Clostridium] ultunense Esp]